MRPLDDLHCASPPPREHGLIAHANRGHDEHDDAIQPVRRVADARPFAAPTANDFEVLP